MITLTAEQVRQIELELKYARNVCAGNNWSTEGPDESLATIRAARAQEPEVAPDGRVAKTVFTLEDMVKAFEEGRKNGLIEAGAQEQAEQEPVGETLPLPDGTLSDSMFTVTSDREFPTGEFVKLYAAPVQQVDLTTSELDAIIEKHYDDEMDLKAMILDGIAAYKEKNK